MEEATEAAARSGAAPAGCRLAPQPLTARAHNTKTPGQQRSRENGALHPGVGGAPKEKAVEGAAATGGISGGVERKAPRDLSSQTSARDNRGPRARVAEGCYLQTFESHVFPLTSCHR